MLEPETISGQSTPSSAAVMQCDPESVRQANRPRSRCAELLVLLFIALCTLGVTVWILLSIALPLIWQEYSGAYNVLLGVLGVFALCVGLYVFRIGWGSLKWTRRYKNTKDTDWYREWQAKRYGDNEVLDWALVHHYVLVTNYKEPIDLLRGVAYSLMSQRCAICKEQITLVFAMEEREGADVEWKANTLLGELGTFFYEVLATFHPPDLPGDIKGKASNYKWAVKEVEAHIRAAARQGDGPSEEHCLIHVADADSLYDPNYFPNVTYHFCVCPDRYHFVWQPCMIPTCNFWDLAAPCRQMNSVIATQEMMSAYDNHEFQIPFSTYGLALKTLQLIGGTGDAADAQDGDVIAEDHHLFIKGYFALDGRLRVHPIFLPCLNFAVGGETKGWCSNICDRYVQAKRHMVALSELVFFVVVWMRGRWCRRRRFGCCTWVRTWGLFWKLLKIHSIPYLGLWVALGLVFFYILKGLKGLCPPDDGHHGHSREHHSQVDKVCDNQISQAAESIGGVVFATTSALMFIGSILVICSFVRMLRATHHTLVNIADPNGSFMVDSSIWDPPQFPQQNGQPGQLRTSPPEAGKSLLNDRDHRLLTIDGEEAHAFSDMSTAATFPYSATAAQQIITRQPRLRRPMTIGGGFPWMGTVLQMIVEFTIWGFISSTLFGSIPAIIALTKLIVHGHRMEYVTAPKTTNSERASDRRDASATGPAASSTPATGSSAKNRQEDCEVEARSPTEQAARGPIPTRSSRRSGRNS